MSQAVSMLCMHAAVSIQSHSLGGLPGVRSG